MKKKEESVYLDGGRRPLLSESSRLLDNVTKRFRKNKQRQEHQASIELDARYVSSPIESQQDIWCLHGLNFQTRIRVQSRGGRSRVSGGPHQEIWYNIQTQVRLSSTTGISFKHFWGRTVDGSTFKTFHTYCSSQNFWLFSPFCLQAAKHKNHVP